MGIFAEFPTNNKAKNISKIKDEIGKKLKPSITV